LYDSNKEGQKSILLKSINYIKSNYNKDITLEKISDKFNLSPYYYSRIFKEFTGKNYSEYITYIRIENAKRMLQENLLSVKEIGFKIGYNDPNYFSRVFKKVLGISPTEYKSKLN
jgi:two-component system response regulator YesN